jgi:hypothetical protein
MGHKAESHIVSALCNGRKTDAVNTPLVLTADIDFSVAPWLSGNSDYYAQVGVYTLASLYCLHTKRTSRGWGGLLCLHSWFGTLTSPGKATPIFPTVR